MKASGLTSGANKPISSPDDTDGQAALKVLLCGGLAGVVTWASIFPLDVIKTRVQTQVAQPPTPLGIENRPLLQADTNAQRVQPGTRLSTFAIARQAYQSEGAMVFFRGLTICSVRAFITNAVQWMLYDCMMRLWASS